MPADAAHNAVRKAYFPLLFGDETTQRARLVLQIVRTELNWVSDTNPYGNRNVKQIRCFCLIGKWMAVIVAWTQFQPPNLSKCYLRISDIVGCLDDFWFSELLEPNWTSPRTKSMWKNGGTNLMLLFGWQVNGWDSYLEPIPAPI
jgi:hypothetical protein